MTDPSTTFAPRPAVVVVGAGAAGLVAAADLAVDHDVVVLDKARGVGGRLATRRLGDATFDHGAQFVTTHSERFAGFVRGWVGAGVATEWYRGQVGPDGVAGHDGHVRYRGTVSMNAVAKHLAEGLDVRRSSRVESLEAEPKHWTLRLDPSGESDRSPLLARGVVMSAPVPQALELLDRGGVQLAADDRSALERISYDPCLAVMLSIGDDAVLPEPGAIAPTDGPLDWVADNRSKGISSRRALTVHVGAAASRDWWDRADAEVVDLVAAELRSLTGTAPGIADWSVQRWRYARPSTLHAEPCLAAGGVPPLVFAGDAFGEAKVEGAVCSGWAAAAMLRSLIRRAEGPGA